MVAKTPVPTRAMTIRGTFLILGKLHTFSNNSTPNAYKMKIINAKKIKPDCLLSILIPNVCD